MRQHKSAQTDQKMIRRGAVAFQLDGQNFLALNGGPYFTFTAAISFIKTKTPRNRTEL